MGDACREGCFSFTNVKHGEKHGDFFDEKAVMPSVKPGMSATRMLPEWCSVFFPKCYLVSVPYSIKGAPLISFTIYWANSCQFLLG